MSNSIVTRSGTQKAKIQTRGMSKTKTNRTFKPNPALLEAKKKAKQRMKIQANDEKREDIIVVHDVFRNAMSSIDWIRGQTGIIYDERMAEHSCLWDPNYPENPERFIKVIERCEELKLIERCRKLVPRDGTKEEILTKHTAAQYELLKSTANETDADKLEELSSHYDAIYLHPTTFHLSCLAVGSTIELVKNICNNSVQNGMAIIRPPGHHAMKAEYNGYCFFNNVAIAAQYALDEMHLKKILIVDWDVHHGQGVQRMFYDDARVLYFSIHRYENGEFWPNLRESNFDAIGDGLGKGYNFNVPLNQVGMKNADYLAIFQQILIPVAVEFQPELIIISAGYDAAFGCPEGLMDISPAFYPHLLSPLMCLAQGKIAVVLEGGYCLQSLAEGAALTLRTLLGDPCPSYESLTAPSSSVQESILNCIYVHRPFWECLQVQKTYTTVELNNVNPQLNLHKVVTTFKGGEPLPEKFPTRNCYAIKSSSELKEIEEKLTKQILATNLTFPKIKVCYVYDDLMMEHRNLYEVWHPEHPNRIEKIRDRHEEYGLLQRMEKLKSRYAKDSEICLAHSLSHVNAMRKTRTIETVKELRGIGETYNSVYLHPKAFDCATLAAGSVLQVVDSVLNGDARTGVCIVRPPGHHAESDLPHGFCIFNNIAIAAQYAIRDHGLKRVLIVDWDVHHGNGTQHIFDNSSKVLYISIHRYDNGSFFPKGEDGNFDVVGTGAGEGFNVNIPWNVKGVGDFEYVMTFQNVIMPIAYEFNPELVLISAGFDAAVGDPLGGCKVSPEAYGYFTHWLSSLANGKVIVCLEGGYNVNSISYAMSMCTKALLGDPLPVLNANKSSGFSSCIETLQNVLSVQQRYWKSLQFHKKLPELMNLNYEQEIIDDFKKLDLKTCADSNSSSATKERGFDEGAVGGFDPNQPGTSRSNAGDDSKTLKDFLEKNHQALANEEMFAVVPLKTCPHLAELKPETVPERINTTDPCAECKTIDENWLCLSCYETLCGRYMQAHMLFHYLDMEHPLALSYSDLSVWCYPCEAYIDNPILFKYKNLAHLHKFGEPLVWSYESDSSIFLDNTIN